MRIDMSEFPQMSLHKLPFTLINAEIGILFRLYANKNKFIMSFDIIVLDGDIIKNINTNENRFATISKQLVESNQTELTCNILAFCTP